MLFDDHELGAEGWCQPHIPSQAQVGNSPVSIATSFRAAQPDSRTVPYIKTYEPADLGDLSYVPPGFTGSLDTRGAHAEIPKDFDPYQAWQLNRK